MRWIVIAATATMGVSACAATTSQVHRATETPSEATPSPSAPSASPAQLLDAQLDAITRGEGKEATRAYGAHALFSGPGVDQVAVGADAATLEAMREAARRSRSRPVLC